MALDLENPKYEPSFGFVARAKRSRRIKLEKEALAKVLRKESASNNVFPELDNLLYGDRHAT